MPKYIVGWAEAKPMLDVSVKQGRIRLLIVDRQPIVLQGLKSVLGAQQDFEVVASCGDGSSCLKAIRNLTPDVTLVADNLPDLTVTEILAIAKAENLPTRLVLFTESEADRDLTAAIAAGASSVISKHASSSTMLRLLRLMAERSVSPEPSVPLPADERADCGGKAGSVLELLTHRERQIARLVSEGMSNKEIARQLNLSPGTVNVHLHKIFQKLEITNRTVLATLALLQRSSGFGLLALAFLAFALADELKATEANDVDPDDDSVDRAGEHAEYQPWKGAILRHLLWDFDEMPTERDLLARASLGTNPAAAIEGLRPADKFAASKLWKDSGPVGSSSSDLPALVLRGTSATQIVGDPTAEHQLPRLNSTSTLIHGGYGTFATLTAALIYALNDDPHLAVQSHEPGEMPIDSFVVVTDYNATARQVAITDADTKDVDGSPPAFPLHDLRLPAALVTSGNECVAGDLGSQDSGPGADIGGDGRDQSIGGKVGENDVVRSKIDFSSICSHSGFDFVSGSSRINLAAFGALAWLHMTAASKSIPPRTLAWIYNPETNETIVYVNPTDRVLDVGDRGLLEIHLQGIVSIAETDFVGQPEGAVVAITLEQVEEALTSATATEAHTVVRTSESTLETAAVWDTLADHGLTFEFGQARTSRGGATRFQTFTNDSLGTSDESHGRVGGSGQVLPIVLAHSAPLTPVENLAWKNERLNESSGSSIAAGGSSQPASEPGSAKAAAELTEAGNGIGNDEHHPPASNASRGSAKAAETDGVEHGNSGHSTSAKSPEAADKEPGIAIAGSAGGNSQHPSESVKVSQAGSIRENGVGNDREHHPAASNASPRPAKTAEADGVEHGNPGHSTSAKSPETADPGESGIATPISSPSVARSAHGNSGHASEPGLAEAAAELPEVGFIKGNGAGNDNGHRPPASDASLGSAKAAEADGVKHGNSGHSSSAKPPEAADSEPGIAIAASAGGNSQHPSESAELSEAGFMRGSGVGNDKEHHPPASDASPRPAKAAEADGVEHGNSGHSNSAKPPAAADSEPGIAIAGSAGGNSQHPSESAELSEAGFIRGNGAGNDNEHHPPVSDTSPGPAKVAEADGVEHGDSGHSTSAKPPEAADSESGIAIAGSAGGNPDYASEPGFAKAEAAEFAEATFGNDSNHPFPASDASPGSANMLEADGAQRGNSAHSAFANPPEAAELGEPSTATTGNGERGNSQFISGPVPPKAIASELTGAGLAPGNDADHYAPVLDVAVASAGEEPTVVAHDKSGHDSHVAEKTPQAGEMAELKVANGNSAGDWPQSAATPAEPVQPVVVSEIGGAELAFCFDGYASSPTFGQVIELDNRLGPHVSPGQDEDLHITGNLIAGTLDEHAVAPVHNVAHHAILPAPHDLLI